MAFSSPNHNRTFSLRIKLQRISRNIIQFSNYRIENETITCVTCTANLAISPELAFMGVGALVIQGGARFLTLPPPTPVTTSGMARSGLSLRGLNDQARLTAEFGMRLAGIQCSCFELSARVTSRPLPSRPRTISSSPVRSAPQSAVSLTLAPGATCFNLSKVNQSMWLILLAVLL